MNYYNVKYSFVVDTNKYTGNFAQEMCSYLVGDSGEYYSTNDEKRKFKRDMQNSDNKELFEKILNILEYQEDRRCYEIYPNPSWFNNGVGGEFRLDDPDADQKALEHWKNFYIKGYEKELERYASIWPKERIEGLQKKLEEAKNRTEFCKRSTLAYLSLRIFLCEKPEDEIVDFIKDRSYSFVEYCKRTEFMPKDLEIEGWRIVETTTSVQDRIV